MVSTSEAGLDLRESQPLSRKYPM